MLESHKAIYVRSMNSGGKGEDDTFVLLGTCYTHFDASARRIDVRAARPQHYTTTTTKKRPCPRCTNSSASGAAGYQSLFCRGTSVALVVASDNADAWRILLME